MTPASRAVAALNNFFLSKPKFSTNSACVVFAKTQLCNFAFLFAAPVGKYQLASDFQLQCLRTHQLSIIGLPRYISPSKLKCPSRGTMLLIHLKYFWGRKTSWSQRLTYNDPDPVINDFLKVGLWSLHVLNLKEQLISLSIFLQSLSITDRISTASSNSVSSGMAGLFQPSLPPNHRRDCREGPEAWERNHTG